jgi:hypothetical protein
VAMPRRDLGDPTWPGRELSRVQWRPQVSPRSD